MYTPDITAYQQIPLGGPTGNVDCTAWSGALITDAHTQGAVKITGRQVRLASDEPKPDPESPGLNLLQVDASVFKLTSGRVDLDTRVQLRSLDRATLHARAADGYWFSAQVLRGVLVDRGFFPGGFRGPHDLTVHALPDDPGVPILGDPLVPHYVRAGWDALFDACEALTGGRIYSQLTRDTTPDYRLVITPRPGQTQRTFYLYTLDDAGRVLRRTRHQTTGLIRPCTPPRPHGVHVPRDPSLPPDIKTFQLVSFKTRAGATRWVDSRFAEEVTP